MNKEEEKKKLEKTEKVEDKKTEEKPTENNDSEAKETTEEKETTEKEKEEKKVEAEANKPAEEETKKKENKDNSKKRWKHNDRETTAEVIAKWEPKTKLGREVKDEKIKDIDEILDKNRKILESEIVDSLLTVKSELINIGQSKGKFGGGKRRIWRQTQRKTKEGNVPTFSTMAVIGDENGHIGIGSGKSKETLPAREKAIRKAKLNIIKIKRACSGFDCSCPEAHTIPIKVTGKCGSVRVTLIPAPQGTGLVVASELKKVLKLAGIKDVYSQTKGRKRTTFNLVKAGIDALKKASK